jgi:hypothetical protein
VVELTAILEKVLCMGGVNIPAHGVFNVPLRGHPSNRAASSATRCDTHHSYANGRFVSVSQAIRQVFVHAGIAIQPQIEPVAAIVAAHQT